MKFAPVLALAAPYCSTEFVCKNRNLCLEADGCSELQEWACAECDRSDLSQQWTEAMEER